MPNPGTTDQFLRFENLQEGPAPFNPRVGTYTLAGPHIMIEPSESPDGCGYFYNTDSYQWHPQQPELFLTLPTQGGRGPQIEAGGKLHWTGQQSLSTSVFDTNYTANWTYDLTYDPGGIEKCKLTATIPQKVANVLKVQVLGGSEGCYAKVKAIKYKVGNKVFTYIKKETAKARCRRRDLEALLSDQRSV